MGDEANLENPSVQVTEEVIIDTPAAAEVIVETPVEFVADATPATAEVIAETPPAAPEVVVDATLSSAPEAADTDASSASSSSSSAGGSDGTASENGGIVTYITDAFTSAYAKFNELDIGVKVAIAVVVITILVFAIMYFSSKGKKAVEPVINITAPLEGTKVSKTSSAPAVTTVMNAPKISSAKKVAPRERSPVSKK